MSKDTLKVGPTSDDVKQQAGYFYDLLRDFVQPLLHRLDQQADRRLVNTFWGLLGCLIRFRHNALGLLQSELGGRLLGEQHAPAGTKRISNLLRSKAWEHTLIETFLLEKAQQQAQQLQHQQQTCVMLWDGSVLEKPESLKAQGLCAVRSSKAKRLTGGLCPTLAQTLSVSRRKGSAGGLADRPGRATQVHRRVRDAHQQQWRQGSALALAVTHAD
jgi:hypothetical protein